MAFLGLILSTRGHPLMVGCKRVPSRAARDLEGTGAGCGFLWLQATHLEQLLGGGGSLWLTSRLTLVLWKTARVCTLHFPGFSFCSVLP